ncbi:MAG: DUF4160 domain-containing protein [Candidatus Zeuxoniibacter abyssi]|nr:MAG: DUF4160 domain-containing protein [Candidatus Persebacteraceae bacterium AB1(2)]
MPTISYFLGIVIQMQYNDHEPPHFHAVYGGERVMVFIDPPRVRGKIPAATRAKVIQWTKLRCDELLENWQRARDRKRLYAVAPLE